MYYSVIYEENQTGYLLRTFYNKLHALELVKAILDDFSANKHEHILTDKTFVVTDSFLVIKKYNILTHLKNICSTPDYTVLFTLELKNSFLYHVETAQEIQNVYDLPRCNDVLVNYFSKNLDNDIYVSLN